MFIDRVCNQSTKYNRYFR